MKTIKYRIVLSTIFLLLLQGIFSQNSLLNDKKENDDLNLTVESILSIVDTSNKIQSITIFIKDNIIQDIVQINSENGKRKKILKWIEKNKDLTGSLYYENYLYMGNKKSREEVKEFIKSQRETDCSIKIVYDIDNKTFHIFKMNKVPILK